MAKAKVTLFGDRFPSRDEEAKIDVYMTNKPTQEYLEFAQITCQDTYEEWSIEQITMKAREIKADGIIIIGKAGTSGIGIPIRTSTYAISEGYGMKAIAIKYKEN